MEWLNFRHLYAFWMVNQTGGFKSASDSMYVSQSTVSEQVSLLEDYFQCKLLERNTRGFKLTKEGSLLLSEARKIFDTSRRINKVLLEGGHDLSSRILKVGIAGGVSRNLAYDFFKETMSKLNISRLDVSSSSFVELKNNCLNFDLDCFISVQPPYGKDLSSFDYKMIQTSPLCLAGSKKIISKLNRKKLSETNLYQFLYPFRNSDIKSSIEKKFQVHLKTKLESNDISLLRFLSGSEDSVCLIPEIGIKEDLLDKRISSISLKNYEKVQFYLVYPKTSKDDPVIKTLNLMKF